MKTRAEQIAEKAKEVWDGSINSLEGITIDDFIEMAEWADKNPMSYREANQVILRNDKLEKQLTQALSLLAVAREALEEHQCWTDDRSGLHEALAKISEVLK